MFVLSGVTLLPSLRHQTPFEKGSAIAEPFFYCQRKLNQNISMMITLFSQFFGKYLFVLANNSQQNERVDKG